MALCSRGRGHHISPCNSSKARSTCDLARPTTASEGCRSRRSSMLGYVRSICVSSARRSWLSPAARRALRTIDRRRWRPLARSAAPARIGYKGGELFDLATQWISGAAPKRSRGVNVNVCALQLKCCGALGFWNGWREFSYGFRTKGFADFAG